MSEIAVEKTRGALVESKHRAIIAVVDAHNKLIARLGDPDTITYWRSAAKPFQVFPLLELSGIEKFGLTLEEIAVMCASHAGEPMHTEAVKSILHKIGAEEKELQCGTHPPLDKTVRRQLQKNNQPVTEIYNNCSGKHAGMLALARLMQVSTDHYRAPEHPVQQKMLHTISELTGVDSSTIKLAKDGCGVPVFGLPIKKMALAYAYFGTDKINKERQALFHTVRKAMTAHPKMVAGTEKFNTRLMEATKGEIVAKGGAQGVFSFSAPRHGLGGTIKVEDGSEEVIGPIMTELLQQLDLADEKTLSELKAFHYPAIKNAHNEIVGKTRPAFSLRQ